MYMPYPKELERLKRKVEKTRPERIVKKRRGEEFPLMSLEERQALVSKYHPDYKEETKREIRVGPNKGDKAPHEIVDLLEAKSRVDPLRVNLSQVDHETDVLIIGGGWCRNGCRPSCSREWGTGYPGNQTPPWRR